MSFMEEATQEFINECVEMLERISLTLTDIEKTGPSVDKYSSIYRDIHTIKGSSQLFGFNQIGTIAHAMEATLDPARKASIELSSDLVDLILKGLDHITNILDTVKKDKQEADFQKELHEYIPRLVDVFTGKFHKPFRLLRDEFADYEILPNEESLLHPPSAVVQTRSLTPPAPVQLEASPAIPLEPSPAPPVELAATAPAKAPEPAILKLAVTAPTHPEEQIKPIASEMKEAAKAQLQTQAPKKPPIEAHPDKTSAVESQDTIRVQVTVLDKLMNLAGELVLVRNQMLRYSTVHAKKNAELTRLSQKINIVTTELQTEVMKTRMQPIGSILSKFNRMIRDLSRDLEKKIELKLEGTETELDKALIEAVKDPLTHIIRNSADHGIELPADRLAHNKPEQGTITVRSYHEGGQVVIEVSDDGRGLNRQRIIEKAVEKKIITADEGRSMSDSEAWQLIFAAGFSTANQVSSISGRGVGMDVVKTNIEKIGGIVELASLDGQGTTILLKIPLTLAIVPALIIKSGGIRFAIPQVKLLEVLRVKKTKTDKAPSLEYIHDKPVYRLRGQLLPLVDLQDFLSVESQRSMKSMHFEEDMISIVVLKAGNLAFGIMVDEIEDNADIVVKPIPQFLKTVGIYVGATILGDGSVALTLDVHGITERAQLNVASTEARKTSADSASNARKNHSSTNYIIFDIGDQGSYAIPMSIVNRLEEFKNSRFEYSGNKRLIQYRDKLLPIISAAQYFHDLTPFIESYLSSSIHQDPNSICPVIVLQTQDRLVGLQVRSITDIIAVDSDIDDSITAHSAIHGTFIHKTKVYTVLDAHKMMRESLELPNTSPQVVHEQSQTLKKLLVVEDSAFFRKHMVRLLVEAGYKVDTAQNGADALQILEATPQDFSLIISDIEMPVLDGFGLAKKVRASGTLHKLPMIAVTTRYRQADIDHGHDVGFAAYLEKLNEEQLIEVVRNILLKQGA